MNSMSKADMHESELTSVPGWLVPPTPDPYRPRRGPTAGVATAVATTALSVAGASWAAAAIGLDLAPHELPEAGDAAEVLGGLLLFAAVGAVGLASGCTAGRLAHRGGISRSLVVFAGMGALGAVAVVGFAMPEAASYLFLGERPRGPMEHESIMAIGVLLASTIVGGFTGELFAERSRAARTKRQPSDAVSRESGQNDDRPWPVVDFSAPTRTAIDSEQTTGWTRRRHARRLRMAIGAIVVLAGLVLLLLPGPGWLVIVAGLGLLAPSVPLPNRLVDSAGRRLPYNEHGKVPASTVAAMVVLGVAGTAISILFIT